MRRLTENESKSMQEAMEKIAEVCHILRHQFTGEFKESTEVLRRTYLTLSEICLLSAINGTEKEVEISKPSTVIR